MSIKNDQWILDQCYRAGMIEPYEESLIRSHKDHRLISYGVSSFGYDLRLSPKEFFLFHHLPGHVVDPKAFNPRCLEPAELHSDDSGQYFILPGHTYGLGVALEHLRMPANVLGICVGKSTYARCSIHVNVTPAEPGFEGHLTLEFSNSGNADCKLYAGEGVCQLLFLQGNTPITSYAKRSGKYQGQRHQVVTARI